jgi:hypothetical protein
MIGAAERVVATLETLPGISPDRNSRTEARIVG